ncbi:unnamed protein product [Protopolystoma xenopodis]|uniref:Uncharacterized protein n=1 Tax=Protopolystoma xenopodis TaxID=117903 RepID=A0A448XEP5_9PLAT|nr:unnamed protein product [Protopolystoma xenopodis]
MWQIFLLFRPIGRRRLRFLLAELVFEWPFGRLCDYEVCPDEEEEKEEEKEEEEENTKRGQGRWDKGINPTSHPAIPLVVVKTPPGSRRLGPRMGQSFPFDGSLADPDAGLGWAGQKTKILCLL